MRRLVVVTRQTGREHGLLVEADAGDQVGSLLPGDRKSIDLAPLLRLMRRDGAYVVVHTHPSDGAFSERDALLLFLRAEVRTIVVVGARGSVYAMSRLPSWTRPSFDALVRAHRTEMGGLDGETQRTIAARAVPRWRALSEQVHRSWTAIAEWFGLRYTRLEAAGR